MILLTFFCFSKDEHKNIKLYRIIHNVFLTSIHRPQNMYPLYNYTFRLRLCGVEPWIMLLCFGVRCALCISAAQCNIHYTHTHTNSMYTTVERIVTNNFKVYEMLQPTITSASNLANGSLTSKSLNLAAITSNIFFLYACGTPPYTPSLEYMLSYKWLQAV